MIVIIGITRRSDICDVEFRENGTVSGGILRQTVHLLQTSFIHSFIHMDVSPNTGGHPYIHIYVIGAKRKFCSDHIKLLIMSTMYI